MKFHGTRRSTFHWYSIVALVLLLSGTAHAAVTLPLEGYARPGRFFPVRVDGVDASRSLRLTAEGCMECQVEGSSSKRIVPMLVTGAAQPRELRWDGGSLALRSLGSNERLIASDSADVSAAALLFPDAKLVAVQLDASDLLPGPPAAWESLDGLLLDGARFYRVNDAQRSALLAGGLVLAATGNAAPDARWPWRREGSVWVLRSACAGPAAELVDDSVYAPTYAWRPGWSAAVRGQVMGVALLVVLFTVSLVLLPRQRRIAVSTAVALSLLSSVGIAVWRRSLGSVDRAGGDIVVVDGGLTHRDSWVYQRAKTDGIETVPWAGWTHPMFGSSTALNRSQMQIRAAGDNQLAFVYQATAGHTMAFVRREVEPGLPLVHSLSGLLHDSPMEQAARAAYLQPGDHITGELPAAAGRWRGVEISK